MSASRLAIAFSIALAVLAGCVTTHGNLTRSADRLEMRADTLARNGPSSANYSSAAYAQDARKLADDAHEFRRTIEDSRAGRRDVDEAFQRLSHTYHELRDRVDRSDSREAQADLRPVTEAYLDVEREMGGYPDRYAGSEDRRDRY